MKKLILLFSLVSTLAIAQAQSLEFKKTWEIEVDPIAYMLNGYSVHVIYNVDHWRFDAGIYGIEQPGSLTGNEDFKTMTRGFGLKVNYLFKKVNGLYTGIDAGYGSNDVTFKETGAKDTGHSLGIGGHVGYRFFLFAKKENGLNGIYLTPWAGLGYNYINDKVKFDGYDESNLGYFATLHMGYRF